MAQKIFPLMNGWATEIMKKIRSSLLADKGKQILIFSRKVPILHLGTIAYSTSILSLSIASGIHGCPLFQLSPSSLKDCIVFYFPLFFFFYIIVQYIIFEGVHAINQPV